MDFRLTLGFYFIPSINFKLVTYEASNELTNFHDKTPYTIMFGPDKCGLTSKVHFIIRHKNPVNGTVTVSFTVTDFYNTQDKDASKQIFRGERLARKSTVNKFAHESTRENI